MTVSQLIFYIFFITKPSIWYQDSEYIKTTEEAWQEAIDIAKSEEGWKEEKSDKKTVGWDISVPMFSLLFEGRHRGES